MLFDFNTPDGFPEELKGTFDCVVIDPPFITREVWEKYTEVSDCFQLRGTVRINISRM